MAVRSARATVAPTPCFMVRSPERLAITTAGQELVRHLVLLTCKIAGENRSRPRTRVTSVREIDAYAFAMPGVYECLEAERVKYAIRISTNQV